MSLITPEAVAAVMELRQVPHTLAELEALVRDGLPKSALRAGVEHATQGADARRALLARIIPEATYKRRRDRLTPDESEKTERLARIVATTRAATADPRQLISHRCSCTSPRRPKWRCRGLRRWRSSSL